MSLHCMTVRTRDSSAPVGTPLSVPERPSSSRTVPWLSSPARSLQFAIGLACHGAITRPLPVFPAPCPRRTIGPWPIDESNNRIRGEDVRPDSRREGTDWPDVTAAARTEQARAHRRRCCRGRRLAHQLQPYLRREGERRSGSPPGSVRLPDSYPMQASRHPPWSGRRPSGCDAAIGLAVACLLPAARRVCGSMPRRVRRSRAPGYAADGRLRIGHYGSRAFRVRGWIGDTRRPAWGSLTMRSRRDPTSRS